MGVGIPPRPLPAQRRGGQVPKLSGLQFAGVVIVGILCLTAICVTGLLTDHNGTLQMGVIGAIASAIGLAAGIVVPGSS